MWAPIQTKDLRIGLGAQVDVDRHGFYLLRERLEFSLLLFDRTTDFVQFVADFERVLHVRSFAQDAEILLFLGAQVTQARFLVDVPLGDISMLNRGCSPRTASSTMTRRGRKGWSCGTRCSGLT